MSLPSFGFSRGQAEGSTTLAATVFHSSIEALLAEANKKSLRKLRDILHTTMVRNFQVQDLYHTLLIACEQLQYENRTLLFQTLGDVSKLVSLGLLPMTDNNVSIGCDMLRNVYKGAVAFDAEGAEKMRVSSPSVRPLDEKNLSHSVLNPAPVQISNSNSSPSGSPMRTQGMGSTREELIAHAWRGGLDAVDAPALAPQVAPPVVTLSTVPVTVSCDEELLLRLTQTGATFVSACTSHNTSLLSPLSLIFVFYLSSPIGSITEDVCKATILQVSNAMLKTLRCRSGDLDMDGLSGSSLSTSPACAPLSPSPSGEGLPSLTSPRSLADERPELGSTASLGSMGMGKTPSIGSQLRAVAYYKDLCAMSGGLAPKWLRLTPGPITMPLESASGARQSGGTSRRGEDIHERGDAASRNSLSNRGAPKKSGASSSTPRSIVADAVVMWDETAYSLGITRRLRALLLGTLTSDLTENGNIVLNAVNPLFVQCLNEELVTLVLSCGSADIDSVDVRTSPASSKESNEPTDKDIFFASQKLGIAAIAKAHEVMWHTIPAILNHHHMLVRDSSGSGSPWKMMVILTLWRNAISSEKLLGSLLISPQKRRTKWNVDGASSSASGVFHMPPSSSSSPGMRAGSPGHPGSYARGEDASRRSTRDDDIGVSVDDVAHRVLRVDGSESESRNTEKMRTSRTSTPSKYSGLSYADPSELQEMSTSGHRLQQSYQRNQMADRPRRRDEHALNTDAEEDRFQHHHHHNRAQLSASVQPFASLIEAAARLLCDIIVDRPGGAIDMDHLSSPERHHQNSLPGTRVKERRVYTATVHDVAAPETIQAPLATSFVSDTAKGNDEQESGSFAATGDSTSSPQSSQRHHHSASMTQRYHMEETTTVLDEPHHALEYAPCIMDFITMVTQGISRLVESERPTWDAILKTAEESWSLQHPKRKAGNARCDRHADENQDFAEAQEKHAYCVSHLAQGSTWGQYCDVVAALHPCILDYNMLAIQHLRGVDVVHTVIKTTTHMLQVCCVLSLSSERDEYLDVFLSGLMMQSGATSAYGDDSLEGQPAGASRKGSAPPGSPPGAIGQQSEQCNLPAEKSASLIRKSRTSSAAPASNTATTEIAKQARAALEQKLYLLNSVISIANSMGAMLSDGWTKITQCLCMAEPIIDGLHRLVPLSGSSTEFEGRVELSVRTSLAGLFYQSGLNLDAAALEMFMSSYLAALFDMVHSDTATVRDPDGAHIPGTLQRVTLDHASQYMMLLVFAAAEADAMESREVYMLRDASASCSAPSNDDDSDDDSTVGPRLDNVWRWVCLFYTKVFASPGDADTVKMVGDIATFAAHCLTAELVASRKEQPVSPSSPLSPHGAPNLAHSSSTSAFAAARNSSMTAGTANAAAAGPYAGSRVSVAWASLHREKDSETLHRRRYLSVVAESRRAASTGLSVDKPNHAHPSGWEASHTPTLRAQTLPLLLLGTLFKEVHTEAASQEIVREVLRLVQTFGQQLHSTSWTSILKLLQGAAVRHVEEAHTAFRVLETIQYTFITNIDSDGMLQLIRCSGSLITLTAAGAEKINVNLSAVQLLWSVADYLAGLEDDRNTRGMVTAEHWNSLLLELYNGCTDKRQEVRHSACKTLFALVLTHGERLPIESWRCFLRRVLTSLLEILSEAVNECFARAREQANLTQSTSTPKTSSSPAGAGSREGSTGAAPAAAPSAFDTPEPNASFGQKEGEGTTNTSMVAAKQSSRSEREQAIITSLVLQPKLLSEMLCIVMDSTSRVFAAKYDSAVGLIEATRASSGGGLGTNSNKESMSDLNNAAADQLEEDLRETLLLFVFVCSRAQRPLPADSGESVALAAVRSLYAMMASLIPREVLDSEIIERIWLALEGIVLGNDLEGSALSLSSLCSQVSGCPGVVPPLPRDMCINQRQCTPAVVSLVVTSLADILALFMGENRLRWSHVRATLTSIRATPLGAQSHRPSTTVPQKAAEGNHSLFTQLRSAFYYGSPTPSAQSATEQGRIPNPKDDPTRYCSAPASLATTLFSRYVYLLYSALGCNATVTSYFFPGKVQQSVIDVFPVLVASVWNSAEDRISGGRANGNDEDEDYDELNEDSGAKPNDRQEVMPILGARRYRVGGALPACMESLQLGLNTIQRGMEVQGLAHYALLSRLPDMQRAVQLITQIPMCSPASPASPPDAGESKRVASVLDVLPQGSHPNTVLAFQELARAVILRCIDTATSAAAEPTYNGVCNQDMGMAAMTLSTVLPWAIQSAGAALVLECATQAQLTGCDDDGTASLSASMRSSSLMLPPLSGGSPQRGGQSYAMIPMQMILSALATKFYDACDEFLYFLIWDVVVCGLDGVLLPTESQAVHEQTRLWAAKLQKECIQVICETFNTWLHALGDSTSTPQGRGATPASVELSCTRAQRLVQLLGTIISRFTESSAISSRTQERTASEIRAARATNATTLINALVPASSLTPHALRGVVSSSWEVLQKLSTAESLRSTQLQGRAADTTAMSVDFLATTRSSLHKRNIALLSRFLELAVAASVDAECAREMGEVAPLVKDTLRTIATSCGRSAAVDSKSNSSNNSQVNMKDFLPLLAKMIGKGDSELQQILSETMLSVLESLHLA